ncbi:MAG TPA: 30S ribosomal protein S20 [Acidobacteriota bacterium]|nr:30S ribosomal protein S20 [Acidobacteriota bacterium]
MGKASSITTKKALRQSKRAQARNKANRTRLKTAVKRFRANAGAGTEADAKKLMPKTQAEIDRAVRLGIIHKNAASRYKSRLARLGRTEKGE